MLRSQPKRPRCRSRRHWFPLPSTGRGIEGGLRVRGGHIQSRNSGLIARLSPWVARATGPYRPATRRTERVRRSFSQRTPFVIGALSFFRHLTFVIRHSQTETIKNPRNITFLQMKPHPTITQRNVANPRVVGRVTPCAPLLTSKPASHPSCHFPNAFLLRNTLCKCLFLQHVTPAASASNSSGRVAPGGRSRAATPFACGAGTLWRGFAEGLRMTLWRSKQPSFPKASLN